MAVGVQYIEPLRIDLLIPHEILQALQYNNYWMFTQAGPGSIEERAAIIPRRAADRLLEVNRKLWYNLPVLFNRM